MLPDLNLAQSLSIPLQDSLRFLQHPLPAALSARLATCFPIKLKWENYGLTMFRMSTINGLGPACPPVAHHLRQKMAQLLYLATYLLVQAYQHLWLVLAYDVYQRFTSVDHTIQP